ncbi:hypothetical protein EXS71_00015 [Candidatus Uhrbacteria bacterium]|nr:hypothetical protein [Candidatus Uhrbacteria bacterium]
MYRRIGFFCLLLFIVATWSCRVSFAEENAIQSVRILTQEEAKRRNLYLRELSTTGGGGLSSMVNVLPISSRLTTEQPLLPISTKSLPLSNTKQESLRGQTAPIPLGSMIKLLDDQNPNTQEDTVVYYIDPAGLRHAFPNEKIFLSWNPNYKKVLLVNKLELTTFPLANTRMTYKPYTHLVKIKTQPRVYIVTQNAVLRWVKTEALAKQLYGKQWKTLIDDLPTDIMKDYQIGMPIAQKSDISNVQKNIARKNATR